MDFITIPYTRYHDVIKYLRKTFFADEPLNKAVELCSPGEAHLDLERLCLATLQDNLSVMAINDDNEIAGVALNGILKAGDLELSKKKLCLSDDDGFKKIFNLLYTENLKNNLFNLYNANKIFEIRILSVDSKFRGQGVAKKLLLKSDEIAKENDFKIMKADATGLFSQNILSSIGFTTISEVRYDSYKDKNGQTIFSIEPPHDKLKIMFKLLE